MERRGGGFIRNEEEAESLRDHVDYDAASEHECEFAFTGAYVGEALNFLATALQHDVASRALAGRDSLGQ